MSKSTRILRFFLRILVNSLYDIEILGKENIPSNRPALLVSNHLSFADPILVSACSERQIHFLMWRKLFEMKYMNWFFKLMACIPISASDGPRKLTSGLQAAQKALEENQLVGIFAEGGISRLGQTRGFKRGLLYVAEGASAPVVPVFIDRIWGSIFSYSGGKFFWKWPKIRRMKIVIAFGHPQRTTNSVDEIRQQVMDLGSEAFRRRLSDSIPADIPRNEWAVILGLKEALNLDISEARRWVSGAAPTSRVFVSPKFSTILCVSVPDIKSVDERQAGGRTGTVGRPLPGVSIRVVDDNGKLLPSSTVGHLQAMGAALPVRGWASLDQKGSIDKEGFVSIFQGVFAKQWAVTSEEIPA